MDSLRASRASLEKEIVRAEAADGRRVTINFADEGLEVAITFGVTFHQLIQIAAHYWRIEETEFVVADQYGVQVGAARFPSIARKGLRVYNSHCSLANLSNWQYIRSMSILEALRHIPGARFHLHRLYAKSNNAGGEGAPAFGAGCSLLIMRCILAASAALHTP